MSAGILTETYLAPNYCAASAGNLVIVNWRAKPTIEGVVRGGQMVDRVLETFGEGAGFLVLLDKDSPPPDGESRDAFAKVMKDRTGRILGSAMVIDGSGLKSAAARVVVAAITLLGDLNPVPQVCGSVDEAGVTLARLLATPHGPKMSGGDIASAARAVLSHGR